MISSNTKKAHAVMTAAPLLHIMIIVFFVRKVKRISYINSYWHDPTEVL